MVMSGIRISPNLLDFVIGKGFNHSTRRYLAFSARVSMSALVRGIGRLWSRASSVKEDKPNMGRK